MSAAGLLLTMVVSPPAATAAQEVPLDDYVAGLRTVDLYLPDADESLPFLFDTGGGLTVITPETADAIGCDAFGRMSGFRSDGHRIDGPRCGPISFELGGRGFAEEAVVFDLMSLLGGAPPIGGLLSLYSFQDQAITLDLGRGRIVLETDETLPERVRSMTPVEIRVGRQAGGAAVDVFLPVRGDPAPAWFLLDSGNTGPVIVAPHARGQVGLPTGDMESGRISIDRVGTLDVAIRFDDRIYDGLLNIGAMEDMVLTLDLRTSSAWLVITSD